MSEWKPTKYVVTKDGLRASRSSNGVWIGSRMMADLQAAAYSYVLEEYAFGRLLDLGCGTCPLFQVYQKKAEEVICVDWANSRHDISHADHECDLNEPLPFEPESFDVVLLSDVLEHISNPDRLWRELNRVLRVGGRVILGVPFMYWIHEAPHDYCRYTRFKLEAFCHENGFAIETIDPIGSASDVVLDIIMKRLAAFRRAVAWVFYYLCRFLRLVRNPKRWRTPHGTLHLAYVLVARKESAT